MNIGKVSWCLFEFLFWELISIWLLQAWGLFIGDPAEECPKTVHVGYFERRWGVSIIPRLHLPPSTVTNLKWSLSLPSVHLTILFHGGDFVESSCDGSWTTLLTATFLDVSSSRAGECPNGWELSQRFSCDNDFQQPLDVSIHLSFSTGNQLQFRFLMTTWWSFSFRSKATT